MNNELDNTSTIRIMPPRKVSDPVYIRIEDLESVREIEETKRRDRIKEYKSRGW